jgi:hypothetical protein
LCSARFLSLETTTEGSRTAIFSADISQAFHRVPLIGARRVDDAVGRQVPGTRPRYIDHTVTTADHAPRFVERAEPEVFVECVTGTPPAHIFRYLRKRARQPTPTPAVSAPVFRYPRINETGACLTQALPYVVGDIALRLRGELTASTFNHVACTLASFCGFPEWRSKDDCEATSEVFQPFVDAWSREPGGDRSISGLCRLCVGLRAALFLLAYVVREQQLTPLELLKGVEVAWSFGASSDRDVRSFAGLRLCAEVNPERPSHSLEEYGACLQGACWSSENVDRIARIAGFALRYQDPEP